MQVPPATSQDGIYVKMPLFAERSSSVGSPITDQYNMAVLQCFRYTCTNASGHQGTCICQITLRDVDIRHGCARSGVVRV